MNKNLLDGWIFKIRNRETQIIDVADTSRIELASHTNSKLNGFVYGENKEYLHVIMGEVDSKDIEGAWRVTKQGEIKEFVPNDGFVGTPSQSYVWAD